MNDDLLTDELLHEMFERRAHRGTPDGLKGSILASASVAQQRPKALLIVKQPLRLLAVAALLAAAVGGGFLVAGRPQPLPPVQHFARFVVPFDYQPVDGVPTDHPVFDGTIVGFTPSGSELYPLNNDGVPVELSRGITLSVVDDAMVHPCPQPAGSPSRVAIRTNPAGFVDDLRAVAGVALSNETNGSFDGRPSVTADIDPGRQRCGGRDFHVDGGGLGSAFVRLDVPSRLIATKVDGRTVVLQVWAATPVDLAAWMPTATRFLDGIHFTGTSPIVSPSPTLPSAEPTAFAVGLPLFAPSFVYQPVDGVPTDTPIVGAGIIAYTEGGPGAQTLANGGTPDSDIYPLTEAGQPLPGTHGITISHLSPGGFVHSCPAVERTPVRLDPEGFVDDLRAVAGVAADLRAETTFDGRPAVVVDVDPSRNRCDSADFHTIPAPGLIPFDSYVDVNIPSRLVVTEVDNTTVVLQAWAATPDELDAWLPTATRFLDGIHFTGASPNATASPAVPSAVPAADVQH